MMGRSYLEVNRSFRSYGGGFIKNALNQRYTPSVPTVPTYNIYIIISVEAVERTPPVIMREIRIEHMGGNVVSDTLQTRGKLRLRGRSFPTRSVPTNLSKQGSYCDGLAKNALQFHGPDDQKNDPATSSDGRGKDRQVLRHPGRMGPDLSQVGNSITLRGNN